MATSSIEVSHQEQIQMVQMHREETTNDTSESQPERNETSLSPVDTGRKAWMFLAASWGVEVVTFGFAASFGVFLDYYRTNAPFAGSNGLAAIGTTTSGLLYIGMPFIVALCRLYPRAARHFTLFGLLFASLALALSSFCTTVPQLLATQGILFGLGGCFAYVPANLYIDEWFVSRKGLAYGILWSAGGVGGVAFPIILESLLHGAGFQTTTRICAGILFGSAAPLSFYVRPRLTHSIGQRRPINMRFVRSRVFVLHQIVNVVQATGYFLPIIYLPTYARDTFGASTLLAALTVMLVNLAMTLGLIIMGGLIDRLHVTTCMLISAAGAAISVLVVWGLSMSLPVLYVFCIFYGLFAGSWASVWPGVMREVAQRCGDDGFGFTDPSMVHGHLCVGKGVGNLISGPLSDTLIKGMPWQGDVIGGYGSGFGVLILYTGVTALLSGMNFIWRRVKVL